MGQGNLISQKRLEEFFFHQVRHACRNLSLRTTPHTEFYLVRLLSEFCQSDKLYPDEVSKKTPLAIRYLECLQSEKEDGILLLRQLGDFTLYMTGFFQDSLYRSNVDIGYYFTLGGNAFHRLHSLADKAQMLEVFQETFFELASKFPSFVEVLWEVSESNKIGKDSDLLRLYERWLATGSQRILDKLQKAGIYPLAEKTTDTPH